MADYCNSKGREAEKKFQQEASLLRLKGSMLAIAAVDRYAEFLENVILPPRDLITSEGMLIATHSDMRIRYQDLCHLPLEQRVKLMH